MEEIINSMKSTTAKLKAKIEDLELQMHLGKKESLDEFENQKIKMKNYLHHTEDNLKQAKDISAEKMISLKAKLEELQVQLALGKAESLEKFNEQKTNLQHKLNDFENDLSELKNKADTKSNEWTEGLHENLDDFKTKMDVFKLNMALGSADAKDEWKEKKVELYQKLNTIKSKLHDSKNVGEEKLSVFNSEIAESFTHLKAAFKKMF